MTDRWETTYVWGDEAEQALAEGWEPFGVVWVPASKNGANRLRYYFKRKVVVAPPDAPIHRIIAFTGGDDNVGVTACGFQIENPNTPTQVGGFTADRSKVTCLDCIDERWR